MADLEKMASSSLNPLSVLGDVASGVFGLVGQSMQQGFAREESEKQRDWNEAMMDKQNEWTLEQWNRTNEYNSPLAQRKRLEEAGLNPLYFGLDGSSAGQVESAQALGYDRAALENMKNPIVSGLEALTQGLNARLAQSQIDKTQAEKNKIESETDINKLDAEYMEKTMQARVEGQKLANELSKEQIAKIGEEKKQIIESVKKTIEETKNEQLKGLLIKSETKLNDAKSQEIAELLPLQKVLIEAQTDAQKAAASLSFAQAAIQKNLLDAGYVEKQIDEIEAKIKQSESSTDANEAIAWLNQWKANMRSGNIYPTNTNSKIMNIINKFGNEFISTVTTFGDIVTGPISNIVK